MSLHGFICILPKKYLPMENELFYLNLYCHTLDPRRKSEINNSNWILFLLIFSFPKDFHNF